MSLPGARVPGGLGTDFVRFCAMGASAEPFPSREGTPAWRLVFVAAASAL